MFRATFVTVDHNAQRAPAVTLPVCITKTTIVLEFRPTYFLYYLWNVVKLKLQLAVAYIVEHRCCTLHACSQAPLYRSDRTPPSSFGRARDEVYVTQLYAFCGLQMLKLTNY